MATTSQIKTQLDRISAVIEQAKVDRANGKAQIARAQSQLAAIPTSYADLIATINAFTPTGAFETLAKDEKAKLQTEFVALQSDVEAELTALGIAF